MAYIVIHSTDPWLLARMATDLQMSSFKWRHKGYFEDNVPFYEDIKWLEIHPFEFAFFRHSCVGRPTRYELTESNYITVLEAVLNAKDEG